PAGLMAKYKFFKIEQDPFNQACWDTIVSGKGTLCSSDFLLARLAVAVSAPFATQNPELTAFFEKLQFKPELLNRMILEMTETRVSGEAMVDRFLREHPEVWHAWLPSDVVERVNTELGISVPADTADAQHAAEAAAVKGVYGIFPDWSVSAFVIQQLMGVVKNYGGFFRQASGFMLTTVLLPVERLMQTVPPWAFLFLVAALSWHATRKPVATVLYVVCLYLIGAVGLWDKLIQTFALVLVSTLVSIVLGVPIGIIAARSRLLRRVRRS